MKTDSQIQTDVIHQLKYSSILNASEIGLLVKNGIVTLSGRADPYSKKVEAEKQTKNLSIAEDIQVGLSPLLRKTDAEIAEVVPDTLKWHSSIKEKINEMKKIFVAFILLSALQIIKANAQVLETEDSRPLNQGQIELGGALEYQTSSEGHEIASPLSIEYGISSRFTLLIEPVPFTGIYPKTSRQAVGLGDLELTLFYQLVKETKSFPAISLSAELKVPTAQDTLIGTRKTDFTPYFIASKTTGEFITSLNLSYTFLGKPKGLVGNNLFNYAAGTVFDFSSKSILFAEIYGNTSAFGGAKVHEGADNHNPMSKFPGEKR